MGDTGFWLLLWLSIVWRFYWWVWWVCYLLFCWFGSVDFLFWYFFGVSILVIVFCCVFAVTLSLFAFWFWVIWLVLLYKLILVLDCYAGCCFELVCVSELLAVAIGGFGLFGFAVICFVAEFWFAFGGFCVGILLFAVCLVCLVACCLIVYVFVFNLNFNSCWLI